MEAFGHLGPISVPVGPISVRVGFVIVPVGPISDLVLRLTSISIENVVPVPKFKFALLRFISVTGAEGTADTGVPPLTLIPCGTRFCLAPIVVTIPVGDWGAKTLLFVMGVFASGPPIKFILFIVDPGGGLNDNFPPGPPTKFVNPAGGAPTSVGVELGPIINFKRFDAPPRCLRSFLERLTRRRVDLAIPDNYI